ncbi:Flagellar hook protein FlgE [hydrothermal vent metagenome]|uniref:Flagellar hook protein FlgE n=1 Tax=hydrothermal vent metagenome TaxID=652676 RepID=A0A3B0SJ15_9ZZZZ
MSLYSALNIGVQGLRANSNALSGISNNIANINTVGFKRTRADFSALVSAQTTNILNAGGGVTAEGRRQISQQGLIQSASSTTDLAIAGNGFFNVAKTPGAVGTTPDLFYTRAGAFAPDENGNLQNASGYYLQGWRPQADGTFVTNPTDTSALSTVNVSSISGLATASTALTFNGNLQSSQTISPAAATYAATASATNMASGTITPDFVRSIQVFDSLGGVRTLNMGFLKDASAANTWNVEIYASPASDVVTGTGLVDGQVSTGSVVFNADGSIDTTNTTLPGSLNLLASDSGAPGAGAVRWATAAGIAGQSVSLDLDGVNGIGGLTQFDAPSGFTSVTANGSAVGNLIGVSIDDDGFVAANFSNGTSRKIYQLPIATFTNANGLAAENGGAYRASSQSGTLTLRQAGQASGTIASQALEGSNVDLAEEFTNLISVQRAYSASSKIITTADEMLDELIRIKR